MKNSELLQILKSPIKWIKVDGHPDYRDAAAYLVNLIEEDRKKFLSKSQDCDYNKDYIIQQFKSSYAYLKERKLLKKLHEESKVLEFDTWDDYYAYEDETGDDSSMVWIKEECEDAENNIENDIEFAKEECKRYMRSLFHPLNPEKEWETTDMNLPTFMLQTMDNHILIYHPEQECGYMIRYFKVPK